MECQSSSERFSPWLDGELPESETARLEAHLLECTQCRQEFESLKTTSQAVENHLESLSPSASLWEGIQHEISPASPKRPAPARPRRFLIWSWLPVAAALIVSVILWPSDPATTLEKDFESFVAERRLEESRPGLAAQSGDEARAPAEDPNPFRDVDYESDANPFAAE